MSFAELPCKARAITTPVPRHAFVGAVFSIIGVAIGEGGHHAPLAKIERETARILQEQKRDVEPEQVHAHQVAIGVEGGNKQRDSEKAIRDRFDSGMHRFNSSEQTVEERQQGRHVQSRRRRRS
jgi:hypothetical protein